MSGHGGLMLVQMTGAWHRFGRGRSVQVILKSYGEALVFGGTLARLGFVVRDCLMVEGCTCEQGAGALTPLPARFDTDVPEHAWGMPMHRWGELCALQAVREYREGRGRLCSHS